MPPPNLQAHLAELVIVAIGVITGAAAIAWVIVMAVVYRRDLRRHRDGHCLQCGYDIRHNRGRCPECGTRIE